jgi:hypothetical protein
LRRFAHALSRDNRPGSARGMTAVSGIRLGSESRARAIRIDHDRTRINQYSFIRDKLAE